MQTTCPFCKQNVELPGENPTQGMVQCPHCGKMFSCADSGIDTTQDVNNKLQR